jgi:RHS repeat-associated protein
LDAFGNSVASTGTTVNPFRFIGQLGYYYDPETGNNYARGRDYRPIIAVWLGPDPATFPNLLVLAAGPTGEDDAERFAAVTSTHRLYANFFRLALHDSDGTTVAHRKALAGHLDDAAKWLRAAARSRPVAGVPPAPDQLA